MLFSVLLMSVIACTMLMVPEKISAKGIITSSPAYTTQRQTVCSGPGANYVALEIIEANQRVYIIDKEFQLDWYHIVYEIGNDGAQNSGYVPVDKLSKFTGFSIYDTFHLGHQGFSLYSQAVYTSQTLEIISRNYLL